MPTDAQEAMMSMLTHPARGDDAILSDEEPYSASVAWSLDELDQSSDLESLRSAWSRTDEPSGG
jgi:hypothetical protein